MLQTCDENWQWVDEEICSSPSICSLGGCFVPPSCADEDPQCGPNQDESCCASPFVPGGTYNRSNDASYSATVSDFRLDRFEITVGRFRRFLDEIPGSLPLAGAGANPHIASSGWDKAWNGLLGEDKNALLSIVNCDQTFQTWTNEPGLNENKPLNCVSWYAVFAFCAWDGGRLPTEAEWNYAAAGGDDQRVYPWDSIDSGYTPTVDATYAVYNCLGDGSQEGDCSLADILSVGSKSPLGDGRWGQADLGGSLFEWNLDWFGDYPVPCTDCANLVPTSGNQIARGGSWELPSKFVVSSVRITDGGAPIDRKTNKGARCARDL